MGGGGEGPGVCPVDHGDPQTGPGQGRAERQADHAAADDDCVVGE